MRDLGLAHVNRIKANLAAAERSPRMQQYVFRTFSQVWNAAFDHGFVKAPCPTKNHSFRLPKVDNEKQRYLTLDEEKTLLKCLIKKGQQHHDMAVVSIDAGLRFGEIAALTWGCVDTGTRIIRVLDSKGKDRFVPMTQRLVEVFDAMEASDPGVLVFPGRNGKPHKEAPSQFRRAVVDAKLNENVTIKKMRASFHTLRHTYASRLVQAGVDLYRVQRLLGHSTPIMTQRYSKLADQDLRRAVETMEASQAAGASGGKVIPIKEAAK
jgi:integrase